MSKPVKQLREFDRVDATPLWSAIEARDPGPEIPPPPNGFRRAAVIVSALGVFLVAVAFAWSAFRPGISSGGASQTTSASSTYVNPMGIKIALDYPQTWFAQSVSQAAGQDSSKVKPITGEGLGIVVSNSAEAVPSSQTPPSPGPLPANPNLPSDFVTVTVLTPANCFAGCVGNSQLPESLLPLSMDDAKVAPGPENVRILDATVANTDLVITVSAGPNASPADVAAADAVVASIRPTSVPSPSVSASAFTAQDFVDGTAPLGRELADALAITLESGFHGNCSAFVEVTSDGQGYCVQGMFASKIDLFAISDALRGHRITEAELQALQHNLDCVQQAEQGSMTQDCYPGSQGSQSSASG